MTPADAWQPIETMPLHRQVLVSDGALVKPAIRVSEASVAAPILMALRMWTHWMPLPRPAPPRDGDGQEPQA